MFWLSESPMERDRCVLTERLQVYRDFSSASRCTACPCKQCLLCTSATVSELPDHHCAISSAMISTRMFCCEQPWIDFVLQTQICFVHKSRDYTSFSIHTHLYASTHLPYKSLLLHQFCCSQAAFWGTKLLL